MNAIVVPPAFHWPITFCSVIGITTWVVSLVTSNVSQIDRLWTILPTIYTGYFALLPLCPDEEDVLRVWGVPLAPYIPREIGGVVRNEFSPRALLMFLLVTLWMIRLTYHAWRRGILAFQEEDYRWEIVRQNLHPILFQILNLVFIEMMQLVLLLSLGYPTYLVVTAVPRSQLTWADGALFFGGLVILFVEFTADNQQQAYQYFKRLYPTSSERPVDVKEVMKRIPENVRGWPLAHLEFTPSDARRGFITRGLWKWSRHPNFLCEQSFWVVITMFPILSMGPETTASGWLPYVPVLTLVALFSGSTWFTETISYEKYPEAYGAYQARVGMFFPVPWGWWVRLRQGREAERRLNRIVWGMGKET